MFIIFKLLINRATNYFNHYLTNHNLKSNGSGRNVWGKQPGTVCQHEEFPRDFSTSNWPCQWHLVSGVMTVPTYIIITQTLNYTFIYLLPTIFHFFFLLPLHYLLFTITFKKRAIESWQYDHQAAKPDSRGSPTQLLNQYYIDNEKNLPSISQTCGMLILSCVLYMFIAWGYPFPGFFQFYDDLRQGQSYNDIECAYACDNEEEEKKRSTTAPHIPENRGRPLLDCKNMTQIYPDGTKAVSGISFSVYSGEVLSFLGANGAGLVS